MLEPITGFLRENCPFGNMFGIGLKQNGDCWFVGRKMRIRAKDLNKDVIDGDQVPFLKL